MQTRRNVPVVAVFGSDIPATLEPAEEVGRAVAASGCILLTGGGRAPEKDLVKERAMQGARRAESDGARGLRVGVLGKEQGDVGIDVHGPEVIIAPGLGDGRNYLNAAMCDAAIALPGASGTISEVVFALALQRPVLLVGRSWDDALPRGESSRARSALVAAAAARVPADASNDLGTRVARAYDTLLAIPRLLLERFELDHPSAGIAAAARRLAEEAGLPGDLPGLADRPDLAKVAERYRAWLAGVGSA